MSCVPNSVLLDSLLARRTAIAFPKEACEMMFWCRKLASTGSFACKRPNLQHIYQPRSNQDDTAWDLPSQTNRASERYALS